MGLWDPQNRDLPYVENYPQKRFVFVWLIILTFARSCPTLNTSTPDTSVSTHHFTSHGIPPHILKVSFTCSTLRRRPPRKAAFPCGSWLLGGGCLHEHSVRGAGPATARPRPQALQHAHRAQLAPVYPPLGPLARCPFDVLILAAALLREVRLAARVARASRGVTPFGAGAITLRLVHVGLRRPGLGLLGLSLLRLLHSRKGDLAGEIGHFGVEACATRAMPSERVIGGVLAGGVVREGEG